MEKEIIIKKAIKELANATGDILESQQDHPFIVLALARIRVSILLLEKALEVK